MTERTDGFRAPLAAYQEQADRLLSDVRAGDRDAAWRFKWLHSAFRDKGVEDVLAAQLGPDDAREVIAHHHAFETWQDLARFTDAVQEDGAVTRFERAADAVVQGDEATLHEMLRTHPALVSDRSARRHHATLLHYVAANGVEDSRQQTPENALEIARMLLDAGAEPDALADMYEERCTTMSMLVSSAHPDKAGLQLPLAELLLDRGALLDGHGTKWQSAVMTALSFGYVHTAQGLARRGASIGSIMMAAGLGRADDVARLLPASDADERHAAFALAAQHGHADVVAMLLDAGENADRFNPDGFHSHSTPMHQATLGEHVNVVRLLVERGASTDIRDTLFDGTPLGWALYCECPLAAAYLESQGAPR